jgi:AcrR family transcriptional regulator
MTGESVKTQAAILDATEKIMREEGYAAVSSRRVAERAGLKSQLIYYHFGTMDELFLALYRRNEEKFFSAHAKALTSRNPLRALWQLSLNQTGTEIELEFIALANHRKAIRGEIARTTQRFRELQAAVFSRVMEELGVSQETLPAEVLSFVIVSLSRGLVTEATLGISAGHEAVRAYIDKRLEALEDKTAPG